MNVQATRVNLLPCVLVLMAGFLLSGAASQPAEASQTQVEEPTTYGCPPDAGPSSVTRLPLPRSVIVRAEAHLRSGPGVQYAIINSVAAHSPISIYAECNLWRLVRTGDGSATGWVHSAMLAPQAAATPPTSGNVQ